MLDDLIAAGCRDGAYIRKLAEVANQVLHCTPDTTTGLDRTKMITIRANRSGRVIDLRISSDWQSRLESEQLGQAIVEASQACLLVSVKGMTARAVESGLIEKLESVDPSTLAPMPIPKLPYGPPQFPPDVMVDQMLTEQPATPETFSAEAEVDGEYPVAVTLNSRRIVGCVLDNTWARRVGADSISWAVMESYNIAWDEMQRNPTRTLAGFKLADDALRQLTSLIQR
ncbi:hypothetical protein [Nocardia sp. NPDC058666]|uniref:hypothetical protein n=1 Tax=unclassified Nocardia TaxID=2637762 RepID=UPI00364DF807